jgi:putative ABC transport system ATP-binding protein
MLARAIASKPRLLLIDGALDGLPDSMIDDLIPGVLQALPMCTCVIATGRQRVAAACRRRVQINGEGCVHEVSAARQRAGAEV